MLDDDDDIYDEGMTLITMQYVKTAISKLKKRKSAWTDLIANELIKYENQDLTQEITTLFNKLLPSANIPDQWRTSITIPIHKNT